MASNLNLDESLESLLNKATNPLNRKDDWEYIMEFCDKVTSELDGYETALKLILHKIKSPQPKEATQALTVLEACVKNCGEPFHVKLGKQEVVDELTNLVLSINYGKPCNEKVKEKLILLLYAWSRALPDQINFKSAYQRLKTEGFVKHDPTVDISSFALASTKSKKDYYFSDQEKKSQLAKLLKSKDKNDLQAANLLIQTAVQADELKMEKSRKRLETLEEVNNNVKLLQDMVACYNANNAAPDDREIMKDLYESCRRLRPVLYRIASASADDDDCDNDVIVDVFASSDKLSRVMDSYEALPPPSTSTENASKSSVPDAVSASIDTSSNLLDLTDFNASATKPTSSRSTSKTSLLDDVFGSNPSVLPSSSRTSSKDQSRLELVPSNSAFSDDFASILGDSTTPKPISSDVDHMTSLNQSYSSLLLGDTNPTSFSGKNSEDDLLLLESVENTIEAQPMFLSKDLLSMSEPMSGDDMSDAQLIDLTGDKGASRLLSKPLFESTKPRDHTLNMALSDSVLDDLFVPLQSIQPSTFPPVTVYDKNGLRVLLHFAKNRPTPYRADILVSVISILSSRTDTVRGILFQVAAPKVMKVKLQPSSCTELSPFNPIFSTPPLTQVMLVANPTLKDVMLRYKLDYKPDNQDPVVESGFIQGFPSPKLWGNL